MTEKSAKNISPPKILALHIASIAKSFARLAIKRIKRTDTKVQSEYDGGHWKRILDEKKWLQFDNLDAYLYSFQPKVINCILNGRHVQIDNITYYRNRNVELLKLLNAQFDNNLEEVVEIGSGTGTNLFVLAALLPDLNCHGLDISPNGVQTATEIAAHFNLSHRLKFDLIDLTDPNHPGFKFIQNKFCFSFFCLEQIPYSIEKVIENLLNSKPKRLLHIEPSTELLKIAYPSDWANYIYVKSVDYQTQMFTVLEKFHQAHRVRVLAKEMVSFSTTLNNRGFMAVWEPC